MSHIPVSTVTCAHTQILNEEKLPCRQMIMTENVRFDQANQDRMINFALPEGSFNGAAMETLCFSQQLPFCPILHHSRRGTGEKACLLMCSEQLRRNKSFQNQACSSFTLTNWDLISKMLTRLRYTKKPAGRGCRGVGWEANLGDAYVLRVPLGLPWIGRIWQKRSVQQKNPPLCLSMGY